MSYDPEELKLGIRIPRKVMKGGSHLCAPNYRSRYHPAARMPQAIDTSTSHLGFRCIVRPGTRLLEARTDRSVRNLRPAQETISSRCMRSSLRSMPPSRTKSRDRWPRPRPS